MHSRFFRISLAVFAVAAALDTRHHHCPWPGPGRKRDAPQVEAQVARFAPHGNPSSVPANNPIPKLIVGIDNLPLDGADRFNLTRDFMTMRKIGVMRVHPAQKLQLRGDRANAEVPGRTMLSLAQFNLRRDVALAWIDRYFAERQLDLLKSYHGKANCRSSATQAAFWLAAGTGLRSVCGARSPSHN